MDDSKIRVAIADDHPFIRLAIEAKLDEIPTLRVIGACGNSTELVALLGTQPCDVLVTDYAMPGGKYGDGLELLTYVQEQFPAVAVVVMTGLDRPVIVQAVLSLGIQNILSKADDMSHLPAAVQAAYVRRRYVSPSLTEAMAQHGAPQSAAHLSAREREVLSLFASGLTINDIAHRLQRSKQTVSTQKVSGMTKLGIDKDADLFKHARELGLLSHPADDLDKGS